jgi:serine/threonine protein phosphatase PrpC
MIREFNLEEHFKKAEPVESIQQAIDKNINERPFPIDEIIVHRSGSTISFAKIFRNIMTKKMLIHMEWLGDSPILVFVNGEILFSSEIHSPSNQREIDILKKRGIPFRILDTDFGFKILDEERIGNNPGKYVIFDEKIQLAFTRSLGHGRIAYSESQKHIIECNIEDEVKVLIFSDGVGDILNMNMDVERLKTFS